MPRGKDEKITERCQQVVVMAFLGFLGFFIPAQRLMEKRKPQDGTQMEIVHVQTGLLLSQDFNLPSGSAQRHCPTASGEVAGPAFD